MIARAFLRPIVNMLVVAGTFLALHGYVEDAGVRGAIAWTAGPLAIEVARVIYGRRARGGARGGEFEGQRRDGDDPEAPPPSPRR